MVTASSKAGSKRSKTPPFAQYPNWSSAKFWGFFRSGLRATYNKWPPKWEALKAARRTYKGKSKQQKWEFRCASCLKYYKQRDVSVDHIVPAGPLNSFADIPGFCERLFVGTEGLQVLCKACHNIKTRKERRSKEPFDVQGS